MGKGGDKHKKDAAPEDDALTLTIEHDKHKHSKDKHGKKKDHKDKAAKGTAELGDSIAVPTDTGVAKETPDHGDHKHGKHKHDGHKHGDHKHGKDKHAKDEGEKSLSADKSDVDALLAAEKCPGCKHHCSLASPRCKKGRQNQKEFLAAHGR